MVLEGDQLSLDSSLLAAFLAGAFLAAFFAGAFLAAFFATTAFSPGSAFGAAFFTFVLGNRPLSLACSSLRFR